MGLLRRLPFLLGVLLLLLCPPLAGRAKGAETEPRGITVDAGPIEDGEARPPQVPLPAAAPPGAPGLSKPRLYLVAIGISRYGQADLGLHFPSKDALDLAAVFRQQQGRLYQSVEARVLTDKEATKPAVLDALDWLQHQTTARDVAVLFLAGHGVRDPATGGYYYLPYEADLSAMKRTMVSQADILTTTQSLAGKVVVFLDTCFSGKLLRISERAGTAGIDSFVQELVSAENGMVVYASSSGRQTSQESPEWRNGAFTRAVIEGLQGRAAPPGVGRVTTSMLEFYISERVKELTGGTQTPTTAKPESLEDFPLAIPLPVAWKAAPAAPPRKRPFYQRAWFWGLVGGVAAAAVAATVTGVLLERRGVVELKESP